MPHFLTFFSEKRIYESRKRRHPDYYRNSFSQPIEKEAGRLIVKRFLDYVRTIHNDPDYW